MRSPDIAAVFAAIGLYLFIESDRGPAANSWRLRPAARAGSVRLDLNVAAAGSHTRWSSLMRLEALEGLSPDDLHKPDTRVRFAIMRDAGALLFEGSIHRGAGAGHLAFRPDPAFARELQRLGYGTVDDETLWSMALTEVNLDFARTVREAGWKASAPDLIRLRQSGID